MAKQVKVVVPGSCNVDLTVFTPLIPRGGETVLGTEFQMSIGGKGTNQATAARRAGATVSMITRIGDDALGAFAGAHYRQEGIDPTFVTVTPHTATGTATILVDETSGQNRIIVASGANARITPDDVLAAQAEIAGADAVILQNEVNPQVSLAAARLAKSCGCRCILNPAPAVELPAELIACADYITPNETEAEFYTGIVIQTPDDAIRAGRALLKHGAACAVLTLGAKGAAIVRPGLERLIPAPHVHPVDTTGAGDCFNGVLAVALSEGLDEVQAVHRACMAASFAIQRKGAAVSCPTRSEIDTMCAAHPLEA